MLQKYLTELKKIKMLSPEEERELWIREEEGDEAAHQKLTSSYQPLVFKTAVQFHMPEEITLELIQEGTVGLLEAAESYDYTKGVAFSLYAVHRIRGRMCDFMNREFSRDELSLDRETAEGWSLAEFIPGMQLLPEEVAERHAVSDRVSQAIDRLPQKEKQVLQGIFLENKTPSVLAADIKVTPGTSIALKNRECAEYGGCCPGLCGILKSRRPLHSLCFYVVDKIIRKEVLSG